MSLSPIILFVYNRPEHTRQTINALKSNDLAKDSELFIYSDGAKNKEDVTKVDEVRYLIRNISGFKTVTIFERDRNWGLAANIIDGVTHVICQYGKVIVLEDDLVTSRNFLRFMNDALVAYKEEASVYSITGYSFTDDVKDIDDSYFLSFTSSWGWATWDKKWAVFSKDVLKLKQYLSDKSLSAKFDYDESFAFSHLAQQQLEGKTNSWAIYWYACVFEKNGLTLYPSKRLVQNIGHDGSGVHCRPGTGEKKPDVLNPALTKKIYEDPQIREIVKHIFSKRKSLLGSLRMKVYTWAAQRLSSYWFSRILQIVQLGKLLTMSKDIGHGTFIDKTVQVNGWQNITIGHSSIISEFAWLNLNVRKEGIKQIIIGNNCYIGKRSVLSPAHQIIVGDYCMIVQDCKLLGSDHVFSDPMSPYLTTGTTFEGSINLESNVWVGAGVSIVGNVSIGRGSVIGAGSIVTSDIPPFSIAVGIPSRVIKRYDFKELKWVDIKDYDLKRDQLMPGEEEYLSILKKKQPKICFPLQGASRAFGHMG